MSGQWGPLNTPADPQNFNRYSYVQNNPPKFRDPSGNEIELTGDQAQAFIDYLEKNSGLKLKYTTKNGVITITGSSKNKSFTGKANKEFADIVRKVAGASGTAKFDVSSTIVNGNNKGEAVFIDDNKAAFNSATVDSSGNKTIRAGNINLTSINSVDGQDTDLAQALVGHTLIEGLEMREKGANFDLGEKGDTSAHQTGLEVERKILGQKDKRFDQFDGRQLTANTKVSFVYTTIQYDMTIKGDGTATITKVSPP